MTHVLLWRRLYAENEQLARLLNNTCGIAMKESPASFEIMTAKEVAAALRVSCATVSRLAKSGKLEALPVDGRLLFMRSRLVVFMETPRGQVRP